jgi:hypothetical protein
MLATKTHRRDSAQASSLAVMLIGLVVVLILFALIVGVFYVRGYNHAIQLEQAANEAGSIEGKIQASNELSGVLSRLLVLQEAYPQLKSNENFLALQDQLEGTENRIAVARTRYNEAVRQLNSYVKSFWGSWFARRAGVQTKPFFEAASGAQQAPKVDFSAPAAKPAEPAAK